jgi:hypothetical protein
MPDIIKTIESWRRARRVHQFLAQTERWADPAAPVSPPANAGEDTRATNATAYGSMVQDAAGFYVFQLGRGEPQRKPVARLWFVFRGRLYGSFEIARIERNAGQFEELVTMYKREDLAKEWHLRPDNWVAICKPPFTFLKGKHVYYSGFQGWRYFELDKYRQTPDARWNF